MRPIHQVLVGAAPGDAITEMARRLRTGLRQLGPSEIYAFGIDKGTDPTIRPLHELPPADPRTVLVYHASYGLPAITDVLQKRRQSLVLVHHNVTPTEFFIEHDAQFASGLEWARTELSYLRDRVVLAVADSEYNRHDLEGLGFADVHVVAAGLQPHRLTALPSDASMARHVHERFPSGYVLCVSQLLPHKRQDTVLGAVHLLQTVHQSTLGVALVGPSRMANMRDSLQRFGERLRLRDFWLVGRTTDRELATLYRGARVLVSASEHEGIGISPLEAMSFGVPVVARGAGAVPDTVGSAAIVLPEHAGPELFAEAIARVERDEHLRRELVHRGYVRAQQMAAEQSVASFVELVRKVVV